MNQYQRQANSPWISLIVLLALMLGYSLLYSFIASFLVEGGDLQSLDMPLSSLYMVLGAGTIFSFMLPALTLQGAEPYFDYFPRRRLGSGLIHLLVLLFLVAFSPLMQIVGEWNSSLSLPESLKGVEDWMRLQEDSMAELTERLVMVDSIPLLLLNIVVMAVFPAVAEEFFFRGNLMHIIQRMVRNHHLSIWITALIFSAIHFQFYGFFPRMLLGAFFGYMLVWSQNIWVAVVAHFINNAFVTIAAFYYASQGKTFADLQTYESYSIFVYISALVLSVALAYGFYRYTDYKKKIYGARMG